MKIGIIGKSRYIDADALLSRLPDELPYKASVKRALTLAPTIDAVEVVRCGDCKWWEKQTDSAQGRCYLANFYPTGAWYCANGERREDDA